MKFWLKIGGKIPYISTHGNRKILGRWKDEPELPIKMILAAKVGWIVRRIQVQSGLSDGHCLSYMSQWIL